MEGRETEISLLTPTLLFTPHMLALARVPQPQVPELLLARVCDSRKLESKAGPGPGPKPGTLIGNITVVS